MPSITTPPTFTDHAEFLAWIAAGMCAAGCGCDDCESERLLDYCPTCEGPCQA